MAGLLPSELWDFGPLDALRGLAAALGARRGGIPAVIELPGIGPGIGVRTARVGIVLALKALGVAPGGHIGVPLYCCPVVFKAIKAAGCTARFLDVDPATYCLSADDLAAKRVDLDAVIAVHMFGNVCDVPRLRAAAPNVPFIEDCAQGLGSRLDGTPAGLLGDMAAFSFHSGKYVSVGEGGALYSAQPVLYSRLHELAGELPVPRRCEECLHVVDTFARSILRTRPFWGILGERVWDVYGKRVTYTSQSPLVMAQVYETDRAATARRLPRLDEWISRQRSIAAYYGSVLSIPPGMLCAEPAGMFYNRLQFPILASSREQCARLVAYLREHRISTARPYSSIAAVAATHYGYQGDCPGAERVASNVFVIPCNHALSTSDVERVALHLNRGWAAVGDHSLTDPAPVAASGESSSS